MNSVMKFMPFMFGYFALVVPSGLTLYWFTSNILAIVQQYFTKTQISGAPAGVTGASISSSSSPVPNSPVPATSGEEVSKEKDAKAKRKSRRKR
jgi:YidC/Oxa1 family membrane protein insertase